MRLLPHTVVVLLAVLTAGCGAVGDPDLDREGYEQLRSQAESLGTEAFEAAAEAVDVAGEVPGSGVARAGSCSGAPDDVVRIRMGTSLVYLPPAPTDADERVVRDWEALGLDVVTDDDGGITAETSIDGERVTVALGGPVALQDGSEQELRDLSLQTGCFDIGADLAREVD